MAYELSLTLGMSDSVFNSCWLKSECLTVWAVEDLSSTLGMNIWDEPHLGLWMYELWDCSFKLKLHVVWECFIMCVNCEKRKLMINESEPALEQNRVVRNNNEVMWKIIQWCSNTVAKPKELKEHRNPTQAQDLWMKRLGNSHKVNRVVNTPPRGRSQ